MMLHSFLSLWIGCYFQIRDRQNFSVFSESCLMLLFFQVSFLISVYFFIYAIAISLSRKLLKQNTITEYQKLVDYIPSHLLLKLSSRKHSQLMPKIIFFAGKKIEKSSFGLMADWNAKQGGKLSSPSPSHLSKAYQIHHFSE